MPDSGSKRVLLVDSNLAIHEDFYKAFLVKNNDPGMMEVERTLFPDKIKRPHTGQTVSYSIDAVCQGEQALVRVQEAAASQRPYIAVFIDLHLTSGWDGITTIQRIWEVDPDLQIIICTTFSIYSWQELTEKLQRPDNFLIVNKPFDVSEIRQLVSYISRKWEIKNQLQEQIRQLEAKVIHQTIHDSLTGLGNCLLSGDCMQQAIEKAKNHRLSVGMLLLAFDDLKEISAAYGYLGYLLRRAELIDSLCHALEHKQFILHYQPLVKADSGQVSGVEALIRWQHPHLGLLYPLEFIPLAEEMGLVTSINEWALKTACTRVKKWQESICPELNIAVNVSASEMCKGHFSERVCEILKKSGLAPRYLELEIMVNYPLSANQSILQVMHGLKETGVRFSMSHFGVGHANLNYLQYLPFDKVKIDKSFVKNMQLNNKGDVVIEAVIGLAKKLGMKVVIEGVETREQVEFLFNYHGEQMQGFYFSLPLSEEACVKLLEKRSSLVKEGA